MAEVKKRSNKWPITTDRFVAFIDIMGFKNMVATMSHSSIYKIMRSMGEAKTQNENLISDFPDLVKSTTYSDSIMLYSRDKTKNSFIALTTVVSGLTNDLFEEGIPHKGAVAYGRMTLDTERSIFFGQPLIDAYLLQEEMHFYGVIIHHTVEARLLNNIENIPFICKFDCPLKSGKSNHLTIHPMHADGDSFRNYPDIHKKLIESLKKMRFLTSGYLRRYIENTELYFKHVVESI